MSYSQYYFRQKSQISFILVGVAVLSIILFASALLSKTTVPSKAKSAQSVINYELVNLTPQGAGIFWQSQKEETGYLQYGVKPDALDAVAGEARDLEKKDKGQYRHHYVQIDQLSPQRRYYFRIVSGSTVIPTLNQTPASFSTPLNTITDLSARPLLGKVVKTDGSPLANAFVMMRFGNYVSQLTQTKLTGEWIIPLSYFVQTTDGEARELPLSGDQKINIEIIGESAKHALIETDLKTLLLSLTTVTDGRSYRLINNDTVLGATDQQKANQNSLLSIIYPKDNAIIAVSRPLLKGTAPPQATVYLKINSDPQQNFRVVADSQGEWRLLFVPSIDPGSYQLEATIINQQNQKTSVSHHFTIAKSGEQVLGEATAEATPTQTVTVWPTVFPSPSQIPSPTAAESGPPVTGINQTVLFAGSVMLTAVGLIMLLAF